MATKVKKTNWGKICFINEETYSFAVYTYDDDPSTLYLANVYVVQEKRGEGLGNQILRMAEEIAKKMGRKEIYLQAKRNSDVHKWYKRHGYVDVEPGDRNLEWMKKTVV